MTSTCSKALQGSKSGGFERSSGRHRNIRLQSNAYQVYGNHSPIGSISLGRQRVLFGQPVPCASVKYDEKVVPDRDDNEKSIRRWRLFLLLLRPWSSLIICLDLFFMSRRALSSTFRR